MRAVLVVSSLYALAAAAPARPADPAAALARFKEVTGGSRWDSVTSVHGTFTVVASGLRGRAEEWVDAVPFELLNNHIYVKVRIDGKGPYLLLCDTGGANIVTPDLAAELGLKPEGALQGPRRGGEVGGRRGSRGWGRSRSATRRSATSSSSCCRSGRSARSRAYRAAGSSGTRSSSDSS